ncbi:MAG: rhamnulokinase [Oscillospiraceae bacterium]|nr:rhamnulokinase [Oscillospiraceae bacterium]MDD4413283.1 rhamnulokinase [Oscillospiraceae bacterium]
MYYLAIDIGASGGRHILGTLQNGKLKLEEIYRFDNGMKEVNGSLTWDINELTENVLKGIEKCKSIGKIPATVAIDTWGVDYVLLDENKNELLPVFAYRDSRTEGIPEKVDKIITRKDLFEKTGIKDMNFNTVYQLFCDKQSGKLQKAKHFMMIPDYLSYKLTGIFANEYTNATTGSLVNGKTNEWDLELIEILGFNKELFLPLSKPATELGSFSQSVKTRVGFDAKVIHAPSHDTASAVAACPIDDDSIYISSGTWSLIGTENKVATLDFKASQNGFSNEGGVEYRYRFLKNIMGMWLFQNIRKNLNKKYTYDEMMNMAKESSFDKLINPNDKSFVTPDNMIKAICTYLGDGELPIADVLKSVYLSLAYSYDSAVKTIEKLSNKTVSNIIIVGGGSKDKYLNELTSKITGKKVITGLDEATATGNILSQIMYCENIDLDKSREIIKNSFNIKEIRL